MGLALVMVAMRGGGVVKLLGLTAALCDVFRASSGSERSQLTLNRAVSATSMTL